MDASGSMKTRDLSLSNNVVSREDWLDAQRERQFWRPLQSEAKVGVESFAAPSTNVNAINGTDLDAALESALHHYKNLKGCQRAAA